MKKVKLLLEPAEVEMILEALQITYDDDLMEDTDMLEGLCRAFGILAASGNFVKVKVDERTHYTDECDCDCDNATSDDDDDDDDDCQCDECRADRGLPPLDEGCDGDPENDETPQVWDATQDSWNTDDDDTDPDAVDPDDSCWDADDDNDFCSDCGCSDCECDVTEQDLENAWNANEPWNTGK